MDHRPPLPDLAEAALVVARRSRRSRARYLRGVAARAAAARLVPAPPVAVLPVAGTAAHPGSAAAVASAEAALRRSGVQPRAVGSVPVPCSGIHRPGRPGIALSAGDEVVARSSAALQAPFAGAVLLGVCDRVLTATLLGAARAGHLPVAIVPVAAASPVLDGLWAALGLPVVAAAELERGVPGRPLAATLDARAVTAGVAAVLAAGGSCRHLLHVLALAAAVGLDVRWSDVERISAAVPDPAAPLRTPAPGGRYQVVSGNLGEAVVDVSGVPADRRVVHAPARVFDDVRALRAALRCGELDRDVAVVLRGVGPQADADLPLHELARIGERGHRVVLVTDGGPTAVPGPVPVAAVMTPSARECGPIGRVRDGDRIVLDTAAGSLALLAAPPVAAAGHAA
jgi:dihydroxyacid dehydratase/phosphogluconate dehydratase